MRRCLLGACRHVRRLPDRGSSCGHALGLTMSPCICLLLCSVGLVGGLTWVMGLLVHSPPLCVELTDSFLMKHRPCPRHAWAVVWRVCRAIMLGIPCSYDLARSTGQPRRRAAPAPNSMTEGRDRSPSLAFSWSCSLPGCADSDSEWRDLCSSDIEGTASMIETGPRPEGLHRPCRSRACSISSSPWHRQWPKAWRREAAYPDVY